MTFPWLSDDYLLGDYALFGLDSDKVYTSCIQTIFR